MGKVEYRAEEDEMLSSYERHPFRPIGLNEREIEHVHYLAVEPIRITFANGNEGSYGTMGTFTEYLSIKYAIDDVSDGSCQNERHAYQKAGLVILLHVLHQEPGDGDGGNDTESGEEELVEDFHAECHTVVFGEVNIEPVGDFNAFVPIHVGLHPNFDDLVDDEYGYHDESREISFREKFLHSVFVLKGYARNAFIFFGTDYTD